MKMRLPTHRHDIFWWRRPTNRIESGLIDLEPRAMSSFVIRIYPGQWRPHCPWEQIAWVSPPWLTEDYVWVDFPEAIFSDAGLLYLSHVDPRYPALFPDLPPVAWTALDDGVRFTRGLPNGVVFGGSLRRAESAVVALELFIRNGSDRPIRDMRWQTCVFLRGAAEFADRTQANKFVHVEARGWLALESALALGEAAGGRFRLGWRQGPRVADLPVVAVRSNQAERWLAMTWFDRTFALIGNPRHPCVHADPALPDLAPGDGAEARGELIFFEGALADLETAFRRRWAAAAAG